MIGLNNWFFYYFNVWMVTAGEEEFHQSFQLCWRFCCCVFVRHWIYMMRIWGLMKSKVLYSWFIWTFFSCSFNKIQRFNHKNEMTAGFFINYVTSYTQHFHLALFMVQFDFFYVYKFFRQKYDRLQVLWLIHKLKVNNKE